MAGQGTVAVELLEQAPADLAAVFVTVGGGGLAGGMATWIKHRRPAVTVVGCQPAASPVMFESVKAGRVVEYASQDTLADGSAGRPRGRAGPRHAWRSSPHLPWIARAGGPRRH